MAARRSVNKKICAVQAIGFACCESRVSGIPLRKTAAVIIVAAAYLWWRAPTCLPRTYRPRQDTLRWHWEMWIKLRGAIERRECQGGLKE
jgi:hypothetical protein